MSKSKTPPTHFVVGTKNANGKDLILFTDEYEAREQLKNLIENGFEDDELIWIEGHRKSVVSFKSISVESVELR